MEGESDGFIAYYFVDEEYGGYEFEVTVNGCAVMAGRAPDKEGLDRLIKATKEVYSISTVIDEDASLDNLEALW